MAECKFCKELEMAISSAEKWNENDVKPLFYEYTVALVSHYWTKERGKENAGRTTDYRHKGLGYELNFCPECGKKIKEG